MRRWPWFAVTALVLSLIVWLADGPGAVRHWAPVSVLVAGLLGWYSLWTRTLADQSWSRRSSVVLVLASTALAFSIALTHASIAFWLVGLVLVALFYVVLPLPFAIVASAALTMHAGWELRTATDASRLPPMELGAFLGSRALIITLVGLFLRSVVHQAEKRQRLADELASTRGSLAAAERLTGVLEERQRVAREIHDTLGQGLSAIVVHLESADEMLPTGDGPVRAQLALARTIARESLDETRRVMSALRPELLEHANLPEAVTRVTTQWAERTGVTATPQITGLASPLHPEAEVTLLRALQEALANARKHAAAHRVDVTLSYMDDLVALDVRDDGKGFAPNERRASRENSELAGCFGLMAMRERVEQLGGRLSIESEPGEGTTLSVSLPLYHTAEMPVPAPPA